MVEWGADPDSAEKIAIVAISTLLFVGDTRLVFARLQKAAEAFANHLRAAHNGTSGSTRVRGGNLL